MRLGTILVTLALFLSSCGKQDEACLTDDQFFEQEVYRKVLQPVCATCHTRGGAARDSNYILENSARPDYLQVNDQMLADLAGCSVPTMRKHLAEAYGDRMTFSRGRTGGLSLAAPAPAPAPVAAETGEDPTAS